MRVVVATGNRGKLAEFADLFAPLAIELVAQYELGIEPAPETAVTFVENALAKARHAAAACGLGAIADDSGLVVPALGGSPGVHSARFAGEGATDADNNARLLRDLGATTDRRAWYYCALVHLRSADDPAPLIATAEWHGTILPAPRGRGGFGYDPLFLVPGLALSAAELPPDRKNTLSHRGQAARMLLQSMLFQSMRFQSIEART